jgi:hypothetical protein
VTQDYRADYPTTAIVRTNNLFPLGHCLLEQAVNLARHGFLDLGALPKA